MKYQLRRAGAHEPNGWDFFWSLVVLAFVLFVASLLFGCKTSPERVAYKTVSAANIAVDTAMTAYAAETVRKAEANVKTRAEDPGGYLQRNREALILHGKVGDALTAYQTAARTAVTAWLLVKANGSNAPPSVPLTAELSAALTNILNLTRP